MWHQQSDAIIRSRKVPSQRRRDGLIRFASDQNSQNGEDGIIERIFQLISITNSDGTSYRQTRLCVDVGAWDGVHLSNTHSLLCNNNNEKKNCPVWRGILIEADPQKFKQLSTLYENTDNILLNVNISVINPNDNANRLHHILEKQTSVIKETTIPYEIDFLCIDIDGADYYVLHDVLHLSQHRPIVICIEFNPTMPNDLIYIPPRSDALRHVSQIKEVRC
jgi:hypothetical protein